MGNCCPCFRSPENEYSRVPTTSDTPDVPVPQKYYQTEQPEAVSVMAGGNVDSHLSKAVRESSDSTATENPSCNNISSTQNCTDKSPSLDTNGIQLIETTTPDSASLSALTPTSSSYITANSCSADSNGGVGVTQQTQSSSTAPHNPPEPLPPAALGVMSDINVATSSDQHSANEKATPSDITKNKIFCTRCKCYKAKKEFSNHQQTKYKAGRPANCKTCVAERARRGDV
mmetsp:Transcript_3244/g.5043  ORF Transcript_3244/g.5043 Transcript_3244/m.5043 type:complete len:230 (+) Transcript_3244:77-766(+)